MIIADNITKYNKEKNPIISNISLNVNKGDAVSVIGPSGSGKSTFLAILSGLIKYDSGNITFNGKSFEDYDIYEYRSCVRYVPPKAEFFSGTVSEHFDVIFKFLELDKKQSLNNVLELLNEFSLKEDILNRDTNDVSTGEGKRLLLIQNLLIKACLYIFDESLSGLDPVLMEKIFIKLKNISETIIITSHDIDFLSKHSNKSIFIKDGLVLESSDNFYKDSNNKEIQDFFNKRD